MEGYVILVIMFNVNLYECLLINKDGIWILYIVWIYLCFVGSYFDCWLL